MEILLLLLLVGGGVLAYRRLSADHGGPELAWSRARAPHLAERGGAEPYRSEAPVPPIRTAVALSRIETGRLLASPLLWVGVALTVLGCLTVLESGVPDQSEWLSLSARFIPLLIFPLCGMVVVATNRAALRSRRDGTVELVESLPARPASRTLAVLLALRGPALVGVACTAALTISIWFGAGKADGQSLWSRSDLGLPFRTMGIADIVSAMVLVVCAGALGVGLARLLPWGMVPIVAVVIVGVATGLLGGDGLPVAVSGLGPLATGADLPAFLAPVAQAWHVVYLLGLGTLAAAVAFGMDGERRWAGRGLVLAAVLVVVSVAVQSRTYAGDTADRIADLVTDPAAHQECIDSPSARVCSYPELMALAEGWLVVASKVSDAAPTAATDGPVEVHVRLSPEEIARLAPPVRAALERRGDSFPWVGEPGLHPDMRWGGSDDVDTRALLVAHELVGLPEPGAAPVVPCFAGGQARSAISIALAGRALSSRRGDDYLAPSEVSEPPDTGSRQDDPTVTDLAEDDWETDTEPAVVHSESDLAVGRALLDRPEDEVRMVLADGWETWIDPATPTADLAVAFGLDADPPSEIPNGLATCA